MRKIFWLSALALGLVSGCNSDPAQQFVGAWTVDQTKTILPKIGSPMIETKIKDGLALYTLKLNNDKSYTGSNGAQAESGTWSFLDTKIIFQPNADSGSTSKARISDGSNDHKNMSFSGSTPTPRTFDVSADHKSITFTQPSPIGDAKVVFRKTG